jgi:cobaltochelatase CobS
MQILESATELAPSRRHPTSSSAMPVAVSKSLLKEPSLWLKRVSKGASRIVLRPMRVAISSLKYSAVALTSTLRNKKTMLNKEEIKSALLDMIASGEINFELPDALISDSVRRNRHELLDMIHNSMHNGGFPKDKVVEMLDERVGGYRVELRKHLESLVRDKQIVRVAVQMADGQRVETGRQHKQFEDLLIVLASGLNAYLVGPAGSGKTTAAEMCAKALKVPFYFTGAITSEFKLTGFIDAQGRVVCPAFRKAYENGGLFLFDEIDASMAQAVLAFNAAIANGMMDFPDKSVEKHKDFYCVAAANTFGLGADRIYVGRNQLDGATIDRFAFIDWDYDHELEMALSMKEYAQAKAWVEKVQLARKISADLKIRHVFSPRASIQGCKLLHQGVKEDAVRRLVLWKGLDKDSIAKIVANSKGILK